MSEENVEAFKRAVDALNSADVEAVLKAVHPTVEWHAFMEELLGGEGGSIRGTQVSASSSVTSATTSTSSTGSTRISATRVWSTGDPSAVLEGAGLSE